MRPASILFAKAPIPGRVKTRLTPPLSSAQAASLHDAFTRDALRKLLDWANPTLSRVELHTDVRWDEWRGLGVSTQLQSGGDLGQKMHHAAASQRGETLIAGSDSPTLPISHLERLISRKGDVILGPTEDGGYYAILMRKTDPRMFDGVAWSTSQTLADTIRAVERAGLSVATGDVWYDIDNPEDLDRLRRDPDVPPHTAAWLRDNPPAALTKAE